MWLTVPTPSGIVACPTLSSPQHAGAPPVLTAHACRPPDWSSETSPIPVVVVWFLALLPQHTTAPVVFTAHEWSWPTDTEVTAADAGAAQASTTRPTIVESPHRPPLCATRSSVIG